MNLKLYYIRYKEDNQWKTTHYQFADLTKFKDWCDLYGISCEKAEIAEFYVSYKDCEGVLCDTKSIKLKFAHIDDFIQYCRNYSDQSNELIQDILLIRENLDGNNRGGI